MIDANPVWGRTRLSAELCRQWGWQSPAGQLKDIACRELLRKLGESGRIALPEPSGGRKKQRGMDKIRATPYMGGKIEKSLGELTPLSVGIVRGAEETRLFKSYIEQYHYLGYGRSVGENMRYIVRDKTGEPLAMLLYGSSAWVCKPRDEYIGWRDAARRENLVNTTNNTRFLILPWVRAPHLASHALSLAAKRISGDWVEKYGHPVAMLETYVERGRFAGTCYKAANWINVGVTAGLGRNSKNGKAALPLKDVYLCPLAKNARRILAGEGSHK